MQPSLHVVVARIIRPAQLELAQQLRFLIRDRGWQQRACAVERFTKLGVPNLWVVGVESDFQQNFARFLLSIFQINWVPIVGVIRVSDDFDNVDRRFAN